jgi:hypothetical protein
VAGETVLSKKKKSVKAKLVKQLKTHQDLLATIITVFQL